MTYAQMKERVLNYFTLPGNGVYTVNTGKEKKEKLFQVLYETKDQTLAEKKWKESLDQFPLSPLVTIIGVASDNGGGILRGANWGPLYLRETLYTSGETITAFDMGDVRVIPHLLHDKYLNQPTIDHCREALYGKKETDLPVSPLSIVEDFCRNHHQVFPHKKIFAMGGDHSIAYPLVKEYLSAKKREGKKVAIIHFDAHTDLLKERLGIDLCFGSWAGQITDLMEDKSLLIQIGIRSSGKPKKYWEKEFGVKQYWAHEFKERKIDDICLEIINHLKDKSVDELYVSFDIDSLDQEYAGATGTPEKGGLSPHEPMLLLQLLYEAFPITGADLMEVAPLTNPFPHQSKSLEPETTLMVASTFATFLIQAMGVKR
ncbi:MAG: arginase family protein [Bacteriovoracaceae bacterium]